MTQSDSASGSVSAVEVPEGDPPPYFSNNERARREVVEATPIDAERSSVPVFAGQQPLPPIVPRIEHQQTHYDFVWAVRPPVVMMPIDQAQKLGYRRQIEGDEFLPPETDLIITTTIADESLREFTFPEEVHTTLDAGARWLVPADMPVYTTTPEDIRKSRIDTIATQYARLLAVIATDPTQADLESITADFAAELAVTPALLAAQPFDILPIIKGRSIAENGRLLETIEWMAGGAVWEPDAYIKYGAQHLTASENGNLDLLANEQWYLSTAILDYTDGTQAPIHTIGMMKPSGKISMADLPDVTTGFSGGSGLNAWRIVYDWVVPDEYRGEAHTRPEIAARLRKAFELLLRDAVSVTDQTLAEQTERDRAAVMEQADRETREADVWPPAEPANWQWSPIDARVTDPPTDHPAFPLHQSYNYVKQYYEARIDAIVDGLPPSEARQPGAVTVGTEMSQSPLSGASGQRQYTDDALVAALWAALVDQTDLSASRVQQHLRDQAGETEADDSEIATTVGHIDDAIDADTVAILFDDVLSDPRRTGQEDATGESPPAAAVGDERLHPPSYDRFQEIEWTPSPRPLVSRFGSWNEAVQVAGFEPR